MYYTQIIILRGAIIKSRSRYEGASSVCNRLKWSSYSYVNSNLGLTLNIASFRTTMEGVTDRGADPGQSTTSPRDSEGWDGKLRVEKKAVVTNAEILSDPEYSDEDAPLVEHISADEGLHVSTSSAFLLIAKWQTCSRTTRQKSL